MWQGPNPEILVCMYFLLACKELMGGVVSTAYFGNWGRAEQTKSSKSGSQYFLVKIKNLTPSICPCCWIFFSRYTLLLLAQVHRYVLHGVVVLTLGAPLGADSHVFNRAYHR